MKDEEKKQVGQITDSADNPLEALVNKEYAEEKVMEPDDLVKKTKKDSQSRVDRLKKWYGSHKRISIPVTVLLVLLLVAAVPWTRYKAAGMVYEKDFNLQLKDSTAGTPVSEARVSIGSVSGLTDGDGKVVLRRVSVGEHKATITKKYYRNTQVNVLVPILGQKSIPNISLVATGRQAKVLVSNIISKNNLSDVEIKVADTVAKTDKDGSATIVLPVGTSSKEATLNLKGYNEVKVTIEAANSGVKENKFNMSPAGTIYFLSKKSGKIDVIKTNLDGTDRKTVLPGTGKEEDRNTILLASRDWKYLALLSRRDSSKPKLYLIETENDKLTSVDEGTASFTLVGWNEENFVYLVDRESTAYWQPKKHALKSYDASKKQLITLDESRGEGQSNGDATYESMTDIYSIGSSIVYFKGWFSYDYSNPTRYQGKQDGVYQINADGTGRKTIRTFNHDINSALYVDSYLYKPSEIYYSIIDGSNVTKYYEYESGKLVDKADLADDFRKYTEEEPRTYLLSPNGNETFWGEPRDGKSALFVSSKDGDDSKEIAALSDEHKVYGWFGDDYLLISKKSSEIYILSRAGIKNDADSLKITDYHKPALNFFSYGGGYGGL
ncbi:carboxypeptidase regulatory-like domain-containing protein [Candidatus Saccharibacteria bacterium]|nr:carboxypeptidase regulatory-like domain-containing protein [Candidatus Saccharibacteria bacterium]